MNRRSKIARSYWERMDRQIPILGEDGQQRILRAKLTIVGCGGTGESLAQRCGLAGFRRMNLVDPDRIDLHNMNRLVLAGVGDVGKPKVLVAKRKLHRLLPGMRINALPADIMAPGVWEQVKDCDWMLDTSDDDQVRHFLNARCSEQKVSLISVGCGFIIRDGRVVSAGCRVNRVRSGHDPCLECQILSEQAIEQAQASLGILNAFTADLALDMLLRELTGYADQASAGDGVDTAGRGPRDGSSGQDVNLVFFDLLNRSIVTERIIPTPGCTWCKKSNSASK